MSVWRRLRGRSPREFWCRGRQLGSQMAERWLGRHQHPPADAPGFRHRTPPAVALEPGAGDLPAVAALVRERWPEECRRLLDEAEAARVGRFDLLGYRGLSFGQPIDWQRDPLRDKRAPAAHWSRVPYLDVAVVGDHKLVWELNRHRHFVVLAQAAWLSGNDGFLNALEQQWREWMAANPPTHGINWASSLEVAFRSIAWLWAAGLARGRGRDRSGFWGTVSQWLMLHGGHLERYLSTYFSPNTHLTGEALGLFYLGCRLEETPTTRRWRETGWRILRQELDRQVHPDGTYFEQTTWYQRYTVDFYLHALLLADEAGIRVPTHLRDRVARAADVLLHVMRPDGTTPLVGDDDGGRLAALGSAEPDDFRGTLALAAVVLNRPEYCFAAGVPGSALVWLLGPAGLDRFEALEPTSPPARSRGFSDGGYYVLRDGWSPESSVMVVDAGPHGSLAAGHAHADALGFDLAVAGAPLFVDPGTMSYVGREREWYRSTAAHNTVAVDGLSSSEPAGMFRWSRWARTSVDAWFTREWVDGLAAWHDGYQRLPDPVVHHRTVLFLRGAYWLILDRLLAAGTHRLRLGFQAAPGVSATAIDPGTCLLRAPRRGGGPVSATLRVASPAPLEPRNGEVSRCYGTTEASLALASEFEATGPAAILSMVAPGERPAPLDGGAVPGGWCWRIGDGDCTDTVVVTETGGSVTGNGLTVRAGFGWLRRTPAGPAAVVGIGPHALAVDGAVLEPAGRVVAARWQDGHLNREG